MVTIEGSFSCRHFFETAQESTTARFGELLVPLCTLCGKAEAGRFSNAEGTAWRSRNQTRFHHRNYSGNHEWTRMNTNRLSPCETIRTPETLNRKGHQRRRPRGSEPRMARIGKELNP